MIQQEVIFAFNTFIPLVALLNCVSAGDLVCLWMWSEWAEEAGLCGSPRLWFGDVMEKKGTFSHLCWCFTLPPITPPPPPRPPRTFKSAWRLPLCVSCRCWDCRWEGGKCVSEDAERGEIRWRTARWLQLCGDFIRWVSEVYFYRLVSSFTQAQGWLKYVFPPDYYNLSQFASGSVFTEDINSILNYRAGAEFRFYELITQKPLSIETLIVHF